MLDVVRKLLEILLKLFIFLLERAERGKALLLSALVPIDLGLLAENPLATQIGTLNNFCRNIALTRLILLVAYLLEADSSITSLQHRLASLIRCTVVACIRLLCVSGCHRATLT